MKSFGLSNGIVGGVVALPYLASVVAMLFWSRHSDATKERVWHITTATFVSAAGFIVASLSLDTPVVALLGPSFGCVGIYAAFPVFWTLPTSFLTAPAAAGAIALITAAANLSGIIAPSIIGWSKDATGGFGAAMASLGGILFLAGLLSTTSRRPALVQVNAV